MIVDNLYPIASFSCYNKIKKTYKNSASQSGTVQKFNFTEKFHKIFYTLRLYAKGLVSVKMLYSLLITDKYSIILS